MTRRAVSSTSLVLACALWMASLGNLPLWRRLAELGLVDRASGALFAASLGAVVFGVLTLLLALFAWRGALRPAATALLIVTAGASHFMLSYGVVIDPGMVTNALQTDPHEAAGLVSWRFAATLALLAGLPIGMLWRSPVAFAGVRRQFGRNLLLVGLGAALAVAAVLVSFQTLASVMRNHKEVRYLINPLAAIYSLGRVASRPQPHDDSVLVHTGDDAHLRHGAGGLARPPMLLLVLGETGRSGNFSLNGYARPTNPELEHEPALVSFRNAWSCGTSTAVSVPCMFSPFGRDGYEHRQQQHEGLLDVLQHAGLAVLWIDNQSGCKGVCDRVPSVSTSATTGSPLCASGECLDGVMLEGLDERIAALDPQRAARGVVIVMHQMGSHGPAYHLRSPSQSKRFPARVHQRRAQRLQPRRGGQRLRQLDRLHRSLPGADAGLAEAPDRPQRHRHDLCRGPWRIAGREQSVPARHAVRPGAGRAEARALDHLAVGRLPAQRRPVAELPEGGAGAPHHARQLFPLGARHGRRRDDRLPARPGHLRRVPRWHGQRRLRECGIAIAGTVPGQIRGRRRDRA